MIDPLRNRVSYSYQESLDSCLLESYINCPPSDGSAFDISTHLKGPLCFRSFENSLFERLELDFRDDEYLMNLKRYFLCVVVF